MKAKLLHPGFSGPVFSYTIQSIRTVFHESHKEALGKVIHLHLWRHLKYLFDIQYACGYLEKLVHFWISLPNHKENTYFDYLALFPRIPDDPNIRSGNSINDPFLDFITKLKKEYPEDIEVTEFIKQAKELICLSNKDHRMYSIINRFHPTSRARVLFDELYIFFNNTIPKWISSEILLFVFPHRIKNLDIKNTIPFPFIHITLNDYRSLASPLIHDFKPTSKNLVVSKVLKNKLLSFEEMLYNVQKCTKSCLTTLPRTKKEISKDNKSKSSFTIEVLQAICSVDNPKYSVKVYEIGNMDRFRDTLEDYYSTLNPQYMNTFKFRIQVNPRQRILYWEKQKRASKLEPFDQVSRRRKAIELANEGLADIMIGKELKVHPKTIAKWKRINKLNPKTLLEVRRKGRSFGACRKLTPEIENNIRYEISRYRPYEVGLPPLLWSKPLIHSFIKQKSNHSFSTSTIRAYFKRWGLLTKNPKNSIVSTCGNLGKDWIKNVYPKILKRAKDMGAVLLWITTDVVDVPKHQIKDFSRNKDADSHENRFIKTKYVIINATKNRGDNYFIFTKNLDVNSLCAFFKLLISFFEGKYDGLIFILNRDPIFLDPAINNWFKDAYPLIVTEYLPASQRI